MAAYARTFASLTHLHQTFSPPIPLLRRHHSAKPTSRITYNKFVAPSFLLLWNKPSIFYEGLHFSPRWFMSRAQENLQSKQNLTSTKPSKDEEDEEHQQTERRGGSRRISNDGGVS
ncbi:unnamed protein product [Brassica oleracea var. botrytis]